MENTKNFNEVTPGRVQTLLNFIVETKDKGQNHIRFEESEFLKSF